LQAGEPDAMTDAVNLQRFVDAQDTPAGAGRTVYGAALAELVAGRKASHWMWFVFPQIHGLGQSATSRHYAISAKEEAKAYLAHPVLGPRLLECVKATLAAEGKTAREIFGSPDDLKFHSCLTLFAIAAPEREEFRAALRKYFGDELDPATIARV
jgi:uncharacterized protein (DUF1810 family)